MTHPPNDNYLTTLLHSFDLFTEEEVNTLATAFRLEMYEKGVFFTEQHVVLDKMFLIEEGIVKECILNAEGEDKDLTRWLMAENQFITIVDSFLTQTPAKAALYAVTPVKLWSIKKEDLDRLYKVIPSLNIIGRWVAERYLVKHESYVEMLRQKPEVRVLWYDEYHPELSNRVPLKFVASYLHLRPETLSRAKKRLTARKKTTTPRAKKTKTD